MPRGVSALRWSKLRRLGMFWRFFFAMLVASTVGTVLFIVATNVVQHHRTNQLILSPEFQQQLRRDFADGEITLELARDNRDICAPMLHAWTTTSKALQRFPAMGPESTQAMIAGGRLRLHYYLGQQEVCNIPALPQPGGRSYDDGGGTSPQVVRVSAVATSPQIGAPARLEIEFRLPQMSWFIYQLVRHLPWDNFIYALAFLNLCCAITLVPILVRRIKHAESVAHDWTTGNFRARIRDHRNDELGSLIRAFNTLADSFEDVIKVKQELAAVEERNRLARDLHDTAKQRAFALNLQLTALGAVIDADPQESARLASNSLALVHHLQDDLSNVIKRLSASTIAESGIGDVLRQELTSLFDGSGVSWRLRMATGIDLRLRATPMLAQPILLIVIEACVNILKHAGAQQAVVAFAQTGAVCTLTVEDNGRGLDMPKRDSLGMGMASMRHRARSLPEGSFAVNSKDDGGVQICVRFRL